HLPGVDLQGTGAQVMVPPSTHPSSGELRVWEENGEPAPVPYQQLWDAVGELARACGWVEPTAKAPRGAAPKAPKAPDEPAPEDAPDVGVLLPMSARLEHARAYLPCMKKAKSGEGGHNTTFWVARVLVNDFALDRENARMLLAEYNAALDEKWTE